MSSDPEISAQVGMIGSAEDVMGGEAMYSAVLLADTL